jgi:hypothetical protein
MGESGRTLISRLTLFLCIASILIISNGIRVNLTGLDISKWPLSELLINYEGGLALESNA